MQINMFQMSCLIYRRQAQEHEEAGTPEVKELDRSVSISSVGGRSLLLSKWH